ncbi:hypothetical protein PIB30_004145 [Stylosanthes scabra]|uniref:Uncharacterized protein n=1 Tax=Stylosanthes scabra TaxID=79078 RepID=A0ABU6Q3H2_9FABA|nr:hypothetical protein [Stylosanthes scabra]
MVAEELGRGRREPWLAACEGSPQTAPNVRKSRSSRTRETRRRGNLTAAAARPGREDYLRGHSDA